MVNAGHLRVRAERAGVVCVLSVSGELDFLSAEDFTQRARRLVDERAERLVLDLSGLRFTDCAGTRALAGVAAMVPAGCPVIVRSARPAVRRILELMDLESVLLAGRTLRAQDGTLMLALPQSAARAAR